MKREYTFTEPRLKKWSFKSTFHGPIGINKFADWYDKVKHAIAKSAEKRQTEADNLQWLVDDLAKHYHEGFVNVGIGNKGYFVDLFDWTAGDSIFKRHKEFPTLAKAVDNAIRVWTRFKAKNIASKD